MSKFPKFKPSEYPTLYVEQTDKELAANSQSSFRYAYFKTIAKGGKSLIQSCKDLHLGRTICYKSLLPQFADDPIEQKRLLREARVSALLQHPNTMPTYELGRNRQGHYYFTMKLVHGYTFREIIDYRERYDMTQLLDIVIQVAYALEYAHTHGVVHRDVKPENILVGPFGEVLLLDWGLAKVRNQEGDESDLDSIDPTVASAEVSMTGFQKLQGTVCYMSPEQITREADIDGRTDIYSLGVLLYEAFTGNTPATGESMHKLLASALHDQPPLPSTLSSTIPISKVVETTVMQCLAKDRTQRIDNVAELIRQLKQ